MNVYREGKGDKMIFLVSLLTTATTVIYIKRKSAWILHYTLTRIALT